MVYQLPSSFSGWMQGAIDSLKRWQLPQSVMSPVVKPQEVKQTTKTTKKTVQPTEVLSFEEKKRRVQLMSQQGASPQAIQAYLDYLKSQEWKPVETPKKSFLERVDKWWADFTAKVISGAIKWTGRIVQWWQNIVGRWLNIASNVILPKQFEQEYTPWTWTTQFTENLAQWFENLQWKMSKQWPINQESWQAKAGEFVWETIPAMYAGGALWKVLWATGTGIASATKTAPFLWKAATKYPTISKTLKLGTLWAAETPLYLTSMWQDVTPWAVTAWGAISAVLPLAWATLSKVWWELWLSGLLKFWAKKKVARQIADEIWESADKIDIFNWMKNRWVTKWLADEETMANRLYQHSRDAYKVVNDIADDLSKQWAVIKADQDVVWGLRKVIAKKAGSESTEEIAKMNRATELLKKAEETGELTLREWTEVKRLMDESLDMFTFQGDVKIRNADNANIRASIRQAIENSAKKFGVNIREYNKEISIARTLADWITDKQISNDLVDRMWNAWSKIFVRWAVGNIFAPFWHDNWTDYLLNAAAGNIATWAMNKTIWNRRVINFISNILTGFTKSEQNIIKNYLKNKVRTKEVEVIIKKVSDKAVEEIKLLPPAEQKLLLWPAKSQLPAQKNALPLPRVPEWTTYPRTDVSAESMRWLPKKIAQAPKEATNTKVPLSTLWIKQKQDVWDIWKVLTWKKVNNSIIDGLKKKKETVKNSIVEKLKKKEVKANLPKKTVESKLPKKKEIDFSVKYKTEADRIAHEEALAKWPVTKTIYKAGDKWTAQDAIDKEFNLKRETPKVEGKTVDPELLSLQKSQESLPWLPKVEVPADYVPKDWLPTWTEFESTVLPTKTKTNKIPSPDIKRPQIRGIDLGIRSNMIDSLKKEGIFTDSFFAITDKNLSNKFIEYAEQKAIKKWVPTTGKEVSMTRLLDTAKNSADTTLTPKEYVKWLDWDKGIYLRFDIGDGNKVAVNSSYTDIFFKNFDDVTFKGSNEVSPVVVYSKWKDVGIIMPIYDPYASKEVLWDFTTTTTNKPSLPMSQKESVKYSEAIDSERATIEKKHPVQRNSTIDVPKSVMERYDTDMPKFAEKYREAIQKLDIPSISKYKKQFLTYLTNNYLNKLWLQGWVKNWYKYAIEEAIKEITDNIVSLKVKK